jgi:hypothetical protein
LTFFKKHGEGALEMLLQLEDTSPFELLKDWAVKHNVEFEQEGEGEDEGIEVHMQEEGNAEEEGR